MIFSYIINLDQRELAPTYAAVRDMADKLLAARGAGRVGVHWLRNFVKRTDSFTTRFNRAYDGQRALCEDPTKAGSAASYAYTSCSVRGPLGGSYADQFT